ncbi:hypothetical protein CI702_23780 [Escherichia coli]|nr:hypothetical protein CI702_23780 [Escherichia coli]HAH3215500.1 hypothetical protein [Escherichia coli]
MITLTKTKRFYMGALVGALFGYFLNKTNNKQHVNRGYDSESGHQIHINGPPRRSVFRFRTPRFKRPAAKSILPNSTRFSPHPQQFAGIFQFGKICF